MNDALRTVPRTYVASEATKERYRYIAALEWRRLVSLHAGTATDIRSGLRGGAACVTPGSTPASGWGWIHEARIGADSAAPASPEHAAALARYIAERKASVTRNTWCQVKSATALWLTELGYLAEAERLRAVDSRGCRRSERRPAKQISQGDYQRLTNALRHMRGLWGARAATLFDASLMTGLRPKEWGRTNWWPKPRILEVPNAKLGNRRAGAEARHLRPSEHAAKAIAELRDARAGFFAAAPPGDDRRAWRFFTRSCSNAVARTTRRLWPRRKQRPDLYTARHQFVANLKAGGVPVSDAARILGHASIHTARHHYGRRVSGWGNDWVHVTYEPAPETALTPSAQPDRQ